MHQNNKVLIVEDEEILAENIMTHIQRHGWEARIAPSGKHAATAIMDFAPQVILLDYHLPDMNGFQILDVIRATHRRCGCVLMTGHPTEIIMAGAEQHGIERILCKPFALADMESSLTCAVDAISDPQIETPLPGERRGNDRRSLSHRIFSALRLNDGSWLTTERRLRNRRK